MFILGAIIEMTTTLVSFRTRLDAATPRWPPWLPFVDDETAVTWTWIHLTERSKLARWGSLQRYYSRRIGNSPMEHPSQESLAAKLEADAKREILTVNSDTTARIA